MLRDVKILNARSETVASSTGAFVLTLAAVAFLAPAASAAPAEEAFKDEIVSIDKDRERKQSAVEIVEDTYQRLAWKTRPGSSPVIRTRDKVISYTYADEPSYYTRGLEAWRGGRWEDAEQEFRGALSAVDAGRAREWVKKHATVYIADCRRRQAIAAANPARYQEAADTFEKALKLDAKSPMLDRILLGQAECLAGAGKHDDALKVCDELTKIARADSLPLWEAAARMQRGKILEDRGETGAAAQEFGDLSGFAGSASASAPFGSALKNDLDDYRVRGLVSQGWALFARADSSKSSADVAAARTFFNGLQAKVGSHVAGRAAANNGRGALLLLEGKAKDALNLFIDVEVTMFAVPAEVARALWYKSKAYEALGNTEGRDEALADLKEFYPWSDWASRAR